MVTFNPVEAACPFPTEKGNDRGNPTDSLAFWLYSNNLLKIVLYVRSVLLLKTWLSKLHYECTRK